MIGHACLQLDDIPRQVTAPRLGRCCRQERATAGQAQGGRRLSGWSPVTHEGSDKALRKQCSAQHQCVLCPFRRPDIRSRFCRAAVKVSAHLAPSAGSRAGSVSLPLPASGGRLPPSAQGPVVRLQRPQCSISESLAGPLFHDHIIISLKEMGGHPLMGTVVITSGPSR